MSLQPGWGPAARRTGEGGLGGGLFPARPLVSGLGQGRPGRLAPYFRHTGRWFLKQAAFEAGAEAGLERSVSVPKRSRKRQPIVAESFSSLLRSLGFFFLSPHLSIFAFCFLKKNFFFCFYGRYLIDSRWFKQWKKYVGFESWDLYNVGEPNLFPGPIDNSGLFTGKNYSELTLKRTQKGEGR